MTISRGAEEVAEEQEQPEEEQETGRLLSFQGSKETKLLERSLFPDLGSCFQLIIITRKNGHSPNAFGTGKKTLNWQVSKCPFQQYQVIDPRYMPVWVQETFWQKHAETSVFYLVSNQSIDSKYVMIPHTFLFVKKITIFAARCRCRGGAGAATCARGCSGICWAQWSCGGHGICGEMIRPLGVTSWENITFEGE